MTFHCPLTYSAGWRIRVARVLGCWTPTRADLFATRVRCYHGQYAQYHQNSLVELTVSLYGAQVDQLGGRPSCILVACIDTKPRGCGSIHGVFCAQLW